MSTNESTAKIALVTGANKGIGFEIARQLGHQGITVLVGARDRGRGMEATERLRSEGINARWTPLEVSDPDSVAAAAREISREFGRVDILVNNAAIFIDDGPPSHLDFNKLKQTFETNVYGPFLVTKAFLPLLYNSAAARIVNLSSGLGSLTMTSFPPAEGHDLNSVAYNSSKTALNALTVQFANELRLTGIKVNLADPGYTATDMTNHLGTNSPQDAARTAVRLALLGEDGPTGGYFNEDGPLPW